MTDREKLIDLCDTNNGWVDEVPADEFADYLIANGVVIRTKGHWRNCFQDTDLCSHCKYTTPKDEYGHKYAYCPHCGAKMEG